MPLNSLEFGSRSVHKKSPYYLAFVQCLNLNITQSYPLFFKIKTAYTLTTDRVSVDENTFLHSTPESQNNNAIYFASVLK